MSPWYDDSSAKDPRFENTDHQKCRLVGMRELQALRGCRFRIAIVGSEARV